MKRSSATEEVQATVPPMRQPPESAFLVPSPTPDRSPSTLDSQDSLSAATLDGPHMGAHPHESTPYTPSTAASGTSPVSQADQHRDLMTRDDDFIRPPTSGSSLQAFAGAGASAHSHPNARSIPGSLETNHPESASSGDTHAPGGNVARTITHLPPELERIGSLPDALPDPGEPGLSRVGRYTLLSELGRGGMGVVYRAWDPQLDRTVALKMLLWGGMAGEVRRRRFLREAQAIARLEHPAIVRIYDSGVHLACPFYTMDYVAGATLQQRLEREGTLSPQEAMNLIAVAARALEHAHARGIVHRDIKPANILMEEGLHPRISDFGIAQLGSGEGDLTETGQVVGTPAYMAPEQALGQPGLIGPQADVYSLGAVLYHLLTGKQPFEKEGHLLPVLRSSLEAPSPRLLQPGIPKEVELVCRKAMAPEPADRYPTALALAEDAERFLRGEPVLASSPTLMRRVQWQLYRYRSLLTGGVLAMCLLLMVAGIWSTYQQRAEALVEEKREAVALNRLNELKQLYETSLSPTELAQAEEATEAFVDVSEVKGTRAHAQSLLYMGNREEQAGDPNKALAYFARAWLTARAEQEQLAALTAMASTFEATGDTQRFQAVLPIVKRFQRSAAATSSLNHLETIAAQYERDLPGLLRRLSAQAKADFLPSLRALGQMQRTGLKFRQWNYTSEGTPIIINLTTSDDRQLVIVDRQAGNVADLPLRVVNAPLGRFFTGPLVELGMMNGQRTFMGHTQGLVDHSGRLNILKLSGSTLVPGAEMSTGGAQSAVTVDLNGDGKVERYVVGSRQLLTLEESPTGQVTLEVAHDETSHSNSEIQRLFTADLDGDQKPELVAILSGWRAYDVRVFKPAREPGKLTLVASRRIGALWDGAPFRLADGQMGIAVTVNVSAPNTRSFPKEHPEGMAPGVYVLRLKGNQLNIEEFIPSPIYRAGVGRIVSADFDGDGRNDLAVQICSIQYYNPKIDWDRSFLQLITRRPDGRLAQMLLPGLLPWLSMNLDSDPADELMAVENSNNELLVLGKGSEPLPPLHAEQETLALLDDNGSMAVVHTSDSTQMDAWDRIGVLMSLGLTQAGIRELITLAANAPNVSDNAEILSQAARLMAQTRKDAEAESLLKTVLMRSPQSYPVLRTLADLYRMTWQYEDEQRLLKQAVASPERVASELPAIRRRLEQLAEYGRRRTDLLQPGSQLDPRWILSLPYQVNQSPHESALVIRAYSPQGDILRVPLQWDNGRLTLSFKARVKRAEWGSTIRIGIREEGTSPDDILFGAILTSGGGGNTLTTHIDPAIKGVTTVPSYEQRSTDPDTVIDVSYRLEVAPDTGEVYAEANGNHRKYKMLSPVRFGKSSFEFVVAGLTSSSPFYGIVEIALSDIELKGGKFVPPPASPVQKAWRSLINGDYAEVQRLATELQPQFPEEAEQLQYLAYCRSGARNECLTRLSQLIRNGALESPRFEALLRDQLRSAPTLFFPPLLAHLGFGAIPHFRAAWGCALLAHPDNNVSALTASIIPSEQELKYLLQTPTSEEQLEVLNMRVDQLRSHMYLKQYDEVISLSEPVSTFGENILKGMPPGDMQLETQETLSHLEMIVARTYARKGLLPPALEHLKRALGYARVKQVSAEEIAIQPEIAQILKEPGFAELLHPTQFTVPNQPPVRGLLPE